MKAFAAQFALVALAVSGALAQGPLTVNTPSNAVVCQPLLITWSGGTPPYFLSIVPGNQPGASALVDFGQIQSATSQTWTVNQPANTLLGINLRDSLGVLAQTAPFSVNPGSNTSCLNAGPSSSAPVAGSSASSGSSTSSSSSTTTTSTTPATTSNTVRPTTTSPSSTPSTSAPATTPSSGAVSKFAKIGVVGVVGAAAAVLMA